MQFSKKVSELSKLYNVDGKDVLFAMLTSAGATAAEAFAVIYRPPCSTTSALSSRASQFIGQRPGLRKLIDELNTPTTDGDGLTTNRRRGRPRKASDDKTADNGKAILDYTDKDAVLKEYADIAVSAEKLSDKLSALNGIATLQRMKQEAKIEEEKRVTFYIPLSFDRCAELLDLLRRYYSESDK